MQSARALLEDGIRQSVLKKSTEAEPIVGENEQPLPWIFDFRAIMGDAKYLNAYADAFWEVYGDRDRIQICGMESAGISLVAAIVLRGHALGKDVNGLYARKGRKKTGLMRAIEGTVRDAPIIFVDDVINSGQSVQRALAVLAEEKCTVTDVCAIVALRSREQFDFLNEQSIRFHAFFYSDAFGIPLVTVEKREWPQYTMLWHFSSPHPNLRNVVPKSAPVIDATRVYFGSDSGTFWALDQKTGDVSWKFRVGNIPYRKGIFSTAAIHNERIFFGAYNGNVYALSTESGEELWRYRDADWVGSSPALAPDLGLLFIGLEYGLWKKQGGIAALSLESGEEKWVMREMPQFTHASPLYIREEKMVVIGSNDGVVYAFRARTGALVWKAQTGGEIKMSIAYDATHRLCVVGTFDGKVYAIRARDGGIVWTYDTGEVVFTSPTIHGDTVYIPSLSKSLHALSLEDGTPRWEFKTPARLFSTAVIANGSLWFGCNDGQLREVDPATGKLRSGFQVGERITNAIAYNTATDVIFLPTQANQIYAIKKQK